MANAKQLMRRGLAKFNKQMSAFSKTLLPAQLVLFQKKIVLELLARVAQKTPVDTGRARGNWQVTINTPAENVIASRQDVVGDGLVALATLQPFQIVWLSNNVEYIEFLEDGTSKQAPNGMVRVSLLEMGRMFD